MFKKLLSNLAFNPSLIGQVSFYAKRMHQESAIRRTGVIMMALALFVQTFAVLSPPEPTLANSNNDMIVGGTTKEGAVQACNNNVRNYKTILTYYGISCSDLSGGTSTTIKSTDHNKKLFSMGYISQGSVIKRTNKPTGETPVKIPGAGTLYLRHLWAFDSGTYSSYKALKITKGTSTYYILYDCGNLVFIGLPPAPKPQPVTPKPDITIEKGVNTKGKTNVYYQSVTVKPGEQVEFSIELFNSGTADIKKTIVKDVLPAGIKAVNGSLAVDGKKVSALLSQFDAGALAPKQLKRVTFSAIVDKTADACGTKTIKNVATVNADGLPVKQDDASVQACQPKETPTPITPQPVPTPETPAPVVPTETPSKPCEESQTIEDKTACLDYKKTVRNVTQNIADANDTLAKANDVVEYTLTVTNKGKVKIEQFVVEENISDVLDYANVVDMYGGVVDEYGNLSWKAVDIAAGATLEKHIMVKIKDPIPQTPISASDPGRNDLQMVNTYGNTTTVKLPSTVIKSAEVTTKTLPNTGPGESLAGVVLLTIFVSYFFARSRLLAKELDIVRTDFASTGGY